MYKVFCIIMFIVITLPITADVIAPTPYPTEDKIIDVTVIDADTGTPLEGVKITVWGADAYGMPNCFIWYTDSNGHVYDVIEMASYQYMTLLLDGYISRKIEDITSGTFELTLMTGPYTITIDSEFAYLIELDPPGCVYEEATTVFITAHNEINPDGSGYYFVEWQGDLTHTGSQTSIYVNREIFITPVYEWKEPFPQPIISGISPASSPSRTQVTITGYHFDQEFDTLYFGPVDNYDYQTQTSYTTDGTTISYIIPAIIYPKCKYDEPSCDEPTIPVTPGMYKFYISNGIHTSNTVLFEVIEATPAPTLSPTSVPTAQPGVELGDVNQNGNIDVLDALLVAQYYVGLNPVINEVNADTDCDGSIDIIDALLIVQYYVGLIDGFC